MIIISFSIKQMSKKNIINKEKTNVTNATSLVTKIACLYSKIDSGNYIPVLKKNIRKV